MKANDSLDLANEKIKQLESINKEQESDIDDLQNRFNQILSTQDDNQEIQVLKE